MLADDAPRHHVSQPPLPALPVSHVNSEPPQCDSEQPLAGRWRNVDEPWYFVDCHSDGSGVIYHMTTSVRNRLTVAPIAWSLSAWNDLMMWFKLPGEEGQWMAPRMI